MNSRFAVFGSIVLIAGTSGCSVPITRFAPADRIDVDFNKVWTTYDEPFGPKLDRLRSKPAVVCDDAAYVQRVYGIIKEYANGWITYWAMPPAKAPVTMTFHAGEQWLGTLDVYPDSLGHVGNNIHAISKQEAADILDAICECVENRPPDFATRAPAESPR